MKKTKENSRTKASKWASLAASLPSEKYQLGKEIQSKVSDRHRAMMEGYYRELEETLLCVVSAGVHPSQIDVSAPLLEMEGSTFNVSSQLRFI